MPIEAHDVNYLQLKEVIDYLQSKEIMGGQDFRQFQNILPGYKVGRYALTDIFAKYTKAESKNRPPKTVRLTRISQKQFDRVYGAIKKDSLFLSYVKNRFFSEYLLSWTESKSIELSCEKVLCLTRDLNWANHHRQSIIDSLTYDEEREFFYILLKQNDLVNQRKDRIIKYASRMRVRDRVHFEEIGELLGVKEYHKLPFFNDIVIYCGVDVKRHNNLKRRVSKVSGKLDLVITSLSSLDSLDNENSYNKNFDAIVESQSTEESHNENSLRGRFFSVWDTLDRENLDNINDGATLNWNSTLNEYLQNSNENEVICEGILQIMETFKEPFKWLDIGSGNGDKLFKIFSELDRNDRLRECHCIEPNDLFYEQIKKVNTTKRYHISITKQTLGGFISSAGVGEINKFEVLSLIHVAYDDQSYRSLCRLIELRPKSKIILVFESKQSDFFNLRQELRIKGFEPAISRASAIMSLLKKLDIEYSISTTKGQTTELNSGELETDEYWLYSFLLGVSKENYLLLPEAKRETVRNLVDQYILEKDLESLSTDDDIIIIN